VEETPQAFGAFAAELPFPLAAYQRQALEALAEPNLSVIVVAPTGSGKSVVADAAIWQALTAGATAAYTSPLRALANQRFAQLTARWGDRAGLLTGDTVVRPHAPCRVLTTELFRTVTLLPELLSADADTPTPPTAPTPRLPRLLLTPVAPGPRRETGGTLHPISSGAIPSTPFFARWPGPSSTRRTTSPIRSGAPSGKRPFWPRHHRRASYASPPPSESHSAWWGGCAGWADGCD